MPLALVFMNLIPNFFFFCTWALGPKWILGIHYTLSKFYGVNSWVLGKIKTSLWHTGKSCLLLLGCSPSLSQASVTRQSSIQVASASLDHFDTPAATLRHPLGGQYWTLSQIRSEPHTLRAALNLPNRGDRRSHWEFNQKKELWGYFSPSPLPIIQCTLLTCSRPHSRTIHGKVSCLHTCRRGYLLFLLDQYSLPFLW